MAWYMVDSKGAAPEVVGGGKYVSNGRCVLHHRFLLCCRERNVVIDPPRFFWSSDTRCVAGYRRVLAPFASSTV